MVFDASTTVEELLSDLYNDSVAATHGNDESTSIHWHFSDDLESLEPSVAAVCADQLEFLHSFKDGWANTEPNALGIPLEWMPKGKPTFWNMCDWMHSSALSPWISTIDTHINLLTRSQVVARHDNPNSFEPDFLIHQPKSLPFKSKTLQDALSVDPLRSISFFLEMATYSGDEDSAESAIPGVFMSTPGCILKSDFKSDFPAPLQALCGPSSGNFALLLDPIASSPPKSRNMKASIEHPALLIGLKGPAPWYPLPSSHSQAVSSPDSLREKLGNLSQLTQPNLITHILNWHLRCEQDIHSVGYTPLLSYRRLPAWFMQFGILYDAEHLTIVAHIPFLPALSSNLPQFSYLSCVIDRIPLTGVARPNLCLTHAEPPILSNVRAALALFALQKHAFMMAELWEGVAWPSQIIADELETELNLDPSSPTQSGRSDDGESFDFDDIPLTTFEQEEDDIRQARFEKEHAENVHHIILLWLDSVRVQGQLQRMARDNMKW